MSAEEKQTDAVPSRSKLKSPVRWEEVWQAIATVSISLMVPSEFEELAR